MSSRKRGKPARFRVGRVSIYLRHGAWWTYYRADGKPNASASRQIVPATFWAQCCNKWHRNRRERLAWKGVLPFLQTGPDGDVFWVVVHVGDGPPGMLAIAVYHHYKQKAAPER